VTGPVTRKASREWQECNDIWPTGFLDNSDRTLLEEQGALPATTAYTAEHAIADQKLLAILFGPNWRAINRKVMARYEVADLTPEVAKNWTEEKMRGEEARLGRKLGAAETLWHRIICREEREARLANAPVYDRAAARKALDSFNASTARLFGKEFAEKSQEWTSAEITRLLAVNSTRIPA